MNDVGRVKVGKQPYSDLSSHSLKDFLRDRSLEFNLFHKISKERFYKPNSTDKLVTATISVVDKTLGAVGGSSGPENKMNLVGEIQDKQKPKQTFLQSLFTKEEPHSQLNQIYKQESNYFFVKRQESESWSTKQYAEYVRLTQKLNSASIDYYRQFQIVADSKAASVQASVLNPSVSISSLALTDRGCKKRILC